MAKRLQRTGQQTGNLLRRRHPAGDLSKALTAAWTTMVPMAVMEYCRPIGRPILHSQTMENLSGRPSPFPV